MITVALSSAKGKIARPFGWGQVLKTLAVALAQQEFVVGDIPGNTLRVLEIAHKALARGARVVVYPELTLTGYPPEDLLLRDSLTQRVDQALETLCKARLPLYLVVGYPRRVGDQMTNRMAVIFDGAILDVYDKQHLPNYQVFDERRYFTPGDKTCVVDIDGFSCGLTICEDLWFDQPANDAKAAGAELILTINGSPYHMGRDAQRRERILSVAQKTDMPILYVNHVYGQDELIFDGGSMAADATGIQHNSPLFSSSLDIITLTKTDAGVRVTEGVKRATLSRLDEVYQALIRGLKDYVNCNGFPGVVLGLSGGIDSGLSLAIAVDALGKERVHAVMMPYAYTSQMSLDDARAEAESLGVNYTELPIAPLYNAGIQTLAPLFKDLPADVTEQNLQARIRGMLLMAISNKTGYMVLTTGNKSEMAVGYATLYGDMCGGFNVLKDVPKMLVFELARHRNQTAVVIPQRVIDRPPSAELAPDQKDDDSLPPYEILDAIIEAYVEKDQSAESIVALGFEKDVVYRVIGLIDRSEYKRQQAPEGVRITARGFGRDRRYPISHGWKPGI